MVGISKRVGVLVFVAFAFSPRAWCWGNLGHMIVGAIAEQRMDPATKAYVQGILGIEPTAFSATWADAVRDDDRFDHDSHEYDRAKRNADDHNFSDYHFVDVPTGTTYDTRPNKDVKDSYGGIAGSFDILKDATGAYPRAAKVIALRYLIHLIGDIHQPLHVGNAHDIGANFCSVMWMKDRYPRNLHSVWDGQMVFALGDSLRDDSQGPPKQIQYYPDYIAALKARRAEGFNQPKPRDASLAAIKGWINESALTRETTIYPDPPGSMDGVPPAEKFRHRAYCRWFEDKDTGKWGATSPREAKEIPLSSVPRLDDAYLDRNLPIAERQILIAGVRLAAVLDQLAREANAQNAIDARAEEAVFTAVQAAFRNRKGR